VVKRLDWDNVGRQKRIERGGRISAYTDLADPEGPPASPQRSVVAIELRNELRRRYGLLLDRFRALDAKHRLAEYDAAAKRVTDIATEEISVLSSYHRRTLRGVAGEEKRWALDRLDRIAGRAPTTRREKPKRGTRAGNRKRQTLKQQIAARTVPLKPLPVEVRVTKSRLWVTWDHVTGVERWALTLSSGNKIIAQRSLALRSRAARFDVRRGSYKAAVYGLDEAKKAISYGCASGTID